MTAGEKIRTKIYLFLVGLWRRMTLGVRVVLADGDQVFLIRHSYTSGWHLPGGGVDPGETTKRGAARELMEETGYRAEGPLVLHGIYMNSGVSDRDHVLVYVCRDFAPARPFAPTGEIAAGGWFKRHELPEGVTPGTRRRLAEIFEDSTQSEHW